MFDAKSEWRIWGYISYLVILKALPAAMNIEESLFIGPKLLQRVSVAAPFVLTINLTAFLLASCRSGDDLRVEVLTIAAAFIFSSPLANED